MVVLIGRMAMHLATSVEAVEAVGATLTLFFPRGACHMQGNLIAHASNRRHRDSDGV